MTPKRDILKSPIRTCTLNRWIFSESQSQNSSIFFGPWTRLASSLCMCTTMTLCSFPMMPTLDGKVTFAIMMREYVMRFSVGWDGA